MMKKEFKKIVIRVLILAISLMLIAAGFSNCSMSNFKAVTDGTNSTYSISNPTATLVLSSGASATSDRSVNTSKSVESNVNDLFQVEPEKLSFETTTNLSGSQTQPFVSQTLPIKIKKTTTKGVGVVVRIDPRLMFADLAEASSVERTILFSSDESSKTVLIQSRAGGSFKSSIDILNSENGISISQIAVESTEKISQASISGLVTGITSDSDPTKFTTNVPLGTNLQLEYNVMNASKGASFQIFPVGNDKSLALAEDGSIFGYSQYFNLDTADGHHQFNVPLTWNGKNLALGSYNLFLFACSGLTAKDCYKAAPLTFTVIPK